MTCWRNPTADGEITMKPDYPWYRLVENDSLEQGDIFSACQVLEPTLSRIEDGAESDIDAIARIRCADHSTNPAIWLMASWKPSGLSLLVASGLRAQDDFFHAPAKAEKISGAAMFPVCMLAACDLPGFASPVRIAELQASVWSTPRLCNGLAAVNPRLRLLPPYREHLAPGLCPLCHACRLARRHSPVPEDRWLPPPPIVQHPLELPQPLRHRQ